MKGQAHLMEYVLLSFFVLLVIVMFTFLLTGWQMSTIGSERERVKYSKAEFLFRAFTNSPYINKNTYKEGSMFEDSKLTAITCEELQQLYGTGWYAEVDWIEPVDTYLEFKDVACTLDTYPECGKWSYCKTEGDARIYELPINIHRKTTGKIGMGMLRVGLYES